MELKVAIGLIEKGIAAGEAQTWLDLGAGQGLFTEALSEVLPEGSTVYAIDRQSQDYSLLKKRSATAIHFIKQDFTSPIRGVGAVTGILMANALHFVEDKTSFLSQLISTTKPSTIILVEYDTDKANNWVPYPLSYNTLKHWVKTSGFGEVVKIGEAPSRYNGAGMYSALIRI